eukprot:3406368-Pleurochrysis_carterae.AAC.2
MLGRARPSVRARGRACASMCEVFLREPALASSIIPPLLVLVFARVCAHSCARGLYASAPLRVHDRARGRGRARARARAFASCARVHLSELDPAAHVIELEPTREREARPAVEQLEDAHRRACAHTCRSTSLMQDGRESLMNCRDC